MTVMRVIVAGRRDGKHLRHTWDLYDRYDPETKLHSMSRTTGFAATSMATLLLRGPARKPGVFPLELLAAEAGLVEAFLAEYARRGVKVTHSVTELPEG
jgi:saccharopine dehydrogenase-like NADP-dependent oxidoreductase